MEQTRSQLVENPPIADSNASSMIAQKMSLFYRKSKDVFFEIYIIMSIAITLLAILVFSFSQQ
ncbi:MAG: hypothetical protein C0614_05640 [Desulfuromonas sp.]|nr:MAG: hypothetical protein C0614_05640 [Desulfuromonas sp.]